MAEITFTKVKLPYGWLGNMSAHPVVWRGKTYPTTEHLFQALRFDENHPIIDEICSHNSPMRAKMAVKPYLNETIIEPRSLEDIENMIKVLNLKIDTHTDLRDALINTGDRTIIEDVSARPSESGLFWGAKRDGTGWTGYNILGECWMSIRREIRSQLQ